MMRREQGVPFTTRWSQIGRQHFVVVTIVAALVGVVGAILSTLSVGPFQSIADVGGRNGSDQLAFFFPAAQNILNGHPFQIYAVRYLGYPNYNPPLSTILIAPILAIGQAFLPGSQACVAADYASVACRPLLGFVAVAFIPFVILLGIAVVAALRASDPDIGQGQLLVAYALVLFSPLVWQDFTTWWHFEQPMMLFFLVAGMTQLRQRPWLAGVLLGLALLSRTTAAVPLTALLVMLLLRRDWPRLIKIAAAIAIVAAIGFGPFFLFDAHDTIFSLLTWRGSAAVGNSIWSVLSVGPLRHIVPHLDIFAAVGLAAVAGWVGVSRWQLDPTDADGWGILALAALTIPMLSKTIWPYYALEPWILLTIWEYGTLRLMPNGIWRWPILSLIALGLSLTLGQYIAVETGGGLLQRLVGIIQFIAMGLVGWAMIVRMEQRWQTRSNEKNGLSLAQDRSRTSSAESFH